MSVIPKPDANSTPVSESENNPTATQDQTTTPNETGPDTDLKTIVHAWLDDPLQTLPKTEKKRLQASTHQSESKGTRLTVSLPYETKMPRDGDDTDNRGKLVTSRGRVLHTLTGNTAADLITTAILCAPTLYADHIQNTTSSRSFWRGDLKDSNNRAIASLSCRRSRATGEDLEKWRRRPVDITVTLTRNPSGNA